MPTNCSQCKQPMEALGKVPLRVGGSTGFPHLFFGSLADMSEDILELDVYRCQRCKRVEFFDLDLSLPVQR